MRHYSGFGDMLAQKVKRLIVPYYIGLVAAVLAAYLTIYKDVPWNLGSIMVYASTSLQSEHLWYLQTIFWVTLLLYPLLLLLERLNKAFLFLLLGIALIVIFVMPLPAYTLVLRYSWYYYVGYLIARYKVFSQEWFQKHLLLTWVAGIGLIVSSFAGQVFFQRYYEAYIGAWFIVEHYRSFLAVSTVTVLAFVFLVNELAPMFVKIYHFAFIRILDEESLNIYIYHIFLWSLVAVNILDPIMKFIPPTPFFLILRKIVGVLCALYLPAVAARLVRKWKDKLIVKFARSGRENVEQLKGVFCKKL